ncbi:uncharacterized protein ACLA_004630 [Aspergillus clavatus NRRL 1]|uniref:Sulfotransferase family protein n=1 Tax=Aspergillus clavatus (strain ATCC 1007 / CBS 513.65 / DSM 816 / NCTC 3887 / NRRL 1 / QM 1276 / 107) TaxID=344612 RepID=A1C5T1_ASPCL|nr:uncharacterized protein ACLA_004630 [Aspergillus clavatus NRRL 1]EAW15049.1 conserved hypothetical protein [Aspergillus clavatus NRRL 1]
MTVANKPSTASRLLLISVPRTASNLLLKIINVPAQSTLLTNEKGGYFFYPPFTKAARDGRLSKPLDDWTEAEKVEIRDALQQAIDGLEQYSARAEQEGKMLFVKEHAFWLTNPAAFEDVADHLSAFQLQFPSVYGPSQTFSPLNRTVMPDEYLRTWRLAFIVRHPALAFPSLYRAMNKIMQTGFMQTEDTTGTLTTNLTLRWTRMLYDWSLEQGEALGVPLILDAHDVIHNPKVVLRFCEQTGLDPSVVQFNWEAKPQAQGSEASGPASQPMNEQDMMEKATSSIMLSTLNSSTGVIKDKTPATVDLATEIGVWKEEFGDEVAVTLEKAVRDAMPDYEYLRSRRVTA